ncbi:MAG: isocitrate/isopropylmalate dehydrogenase family protein [Firmicutes bacterium]|nr:isocitrate/isopropylmalate dehydrogenase family protein [Bacillota bacterium]HOB21392.1 isocitrate/isopropylmalate dehydrogenase family protein [Bacillota bacterium]HQD39894.1 isocitrate/isopropylmalate dehydrogenase family protein [Bacillota bacterium]
MAYRVTLIPGDGIGPELVEAGRRVLEATGVEFDWDVQLAGSEIMEQEGTPLPQRVIDSIRQNKVALKGPITTPIGTGFRSVNVALRHELDLYACIRPCKSYAGVQSARYQNIDLVVVRENTEDLYAGVEFEANSSEAKEIIAKSAGKINPDAAISIKPISASGSRRIIKHAFDYAVANGRKKVTAIAKANIMKFTDGLFFEVGREVAKEYPDIEYEERLIDNMCMQLVMHPENYDVLVLPNLYGDIISDLCAGLVGGLGLAPGANIGEKGALFEPTHGSAPKYKGLNKANPTAFILSGVMMLRHLKEFEAAERVERAIAKVIEEGKNVTYDLKADRNDPTAVGTQEMADAIIAAME